MLHCPMGLATLVPHIGSVHYSCSPSSGTEGWSWIQLELSTYGAEEDTEAAQSSSLSWLSQHFPLCPDFLPIEATSPTSFLLGTLLGSILLPPAKTPAAGSDAVRSKLQKSSMKHRTSCSWPGKNCRALKL